ncbi:hypothetical protein V6N12_046867 [Hibiscus sabdariffa]|uniref:Uncharacterized protein n=1 Tax=Hibiscus sabdariffa TaxID=183260 RepID=A0ABR2ABH6_9ROSI
MPVVHQYPVFETDPTLSENRHARKTYKPSIPETQQFPFSYLPIGGEEDGGSFARTRHQFLEARFHFQVDYVYNKWERTLLWDMLEPYRRPKSFTPLVTIYIAAFYTGVVGAAVTEQLYKEKHWEDHPGEAVPLMKPKFYGGPWKVLKGDVLPPNE